MFRPLAVIPLSASHSEIFKNILICFWNMESSLRIPMVKGCVSKRVGRGLNYQNLIFLRRVNVKKIHFFIFYFFRILNIFFLIWKQHWLHLRQFSVILSKRSHDLCQNLYIDILVVLSLSERRKQQKKFENS